MWSCFSLRVLHEAWMRWYVKQSQIIFIYIINSIGFKLIAICPDGKAFSASCFNPSLMLECRCSSNQGYTFRTRKYWSIPWENLRNERAHPTTGRLPSRYPSGCLASASPRRSSPHQSSCRTKQQSWHVFSIAPAVHDYCQNGRTKPSDQSWRSECPLFA